MHNGLAAGDEVILLRQQEGQKYIVLESTLGNSIVNSQEKVGFQK